MHKLLLARLCPQAALSLAMWCAHLSDKSFVSCASSCVISQIGDVYEVEVNPPNLMDGVRWDSNEEMASEL